MYSRAGSHLQEHPSGRKETDTNFDGIEGFILKAIENADGIPFQLIFGTQVGSGHYLRIGDGIKSLLGIDPEDFTEESFHKMILQIIPVLPEVPSDINNAREKFINGELGSYKADILVKAGDGRKIWLRDSSIPIKDKNSGRVVGAFGILSEIKSKRNHSGSSDECEKLKTAFLRNISHEIRTPLNAIVGFSHLIGEPGTKGDKVMEYKKIINDSSDQLLEVMTDIIEMSKIDAGQVTANYEECDVSEMIDTILSEYSEESREKGLLLVNRSKNGSGETKIISDNHKLSYILRSLVKNAIKFSDKGEIEVALSRSAGSVEVKVSDNGIGIPYEHQQNLFACFSQADSSVTRRFGGKGLGLAISKSYAEMMGGEINCVSSVGKGTTFRVIIPSRSN